MAVKISFDPSGIPEYPTLILANKNGDKLGKIDAKNITLKDCMLNASELSFSVYKYTENILNPLWNQIKDFKLIYCKELDMWFEITVSIDEDDNTIKNVQCTQLGHAELSQIMLYDIEINTETDIARDNYKSPTVLYNEEDSSISLLHRIMEKAKHYTVLHVDSSITKIQRTFSFSDISLYDAFNEIADEIGCIFILHSNSDENGNIQRTISVYDLESNCISCGHRGDFVDTCPECGSTNVLNGYGNDTTIFVDTDDLGNNIHFETDGGAVKNCFKLEAGDDLMTAAIRNCNPNGTDYIWYISEDTKAEMSKELSNKINQYNIDYERYQNTYSISISPSLISSYNNIVNKYISNNSNLSTISSPISGYINLMISYYKTVDMALYLKSSMMPNISLNIGTTASDEIRKLTSGNLSPVSVSNINTISLATANNAVLSVAKCIINSNYQIKIDSSYLDNNVWTGAFIITNYSDETDVAISSNVSIIIDDNYENFVEQKIKKAITKDDNKNIDTFELFKKDLELFKIELKKYSLDNLNIFWNICRTCLDILIEHGIADKEYYNDKNPNLYKELYLPYYNKLKSIEAEQKVREDELTVVIGKYDSYGVLTQNGLQPQLEKERYKIQNTLNFEKYLGTALWLEFCSFRRDDKYSNHNYISDGLNNTDLFNRALEFINVAKKEIYKSAELQHSITSSLKNLLVIKKFEPLINNFKCGNWIRVMINDVVYKLRLIDYEIDYDNLENIVVTFSDVTKGITGLSDTESLLNQVENMASSYDSVQKQVNQNTKTKKQLDNWVTDGLNLTKMKIVDDASNQNITWDEHGLLCREYSPITDIYSDKQLKIINKGLYLTDDDWLTSKAGIGEFTFYNPKTQQIETSYGVIADTLVGNLVLSEEVGIYNKNNSISLDQNGLNITTNTTNTAFNIQRKNSNGSTTKLLYVDGNGNLVVNGSLSVNSSSGDINNGNNNTNQITTIDDIIDKTINAVKSVDVEYYISDYSDRLSGGEWVTSITELSDNKYIWSRTKTIYNDNSIEYSPSENGSLVTTSNKEGESALSVQINSSNGNIFKGSNIQTTLTATVYYGITDVTSKVKSFTWKKINQDGTIDESWNRTMSGNVITITDADIFNKASFTCIVDIDI